MLFLSFRITSWRDEKSVESTTCESKITLLRLEMTIPGQPPNACTQDKTGVWFLHC